MSKKYNVGINQENYFQFSCGFSFLYKRDTERELKIKIHKKNCSTCILRNATREIVEIKDSSLKPELNNYLSKCVRNIVNECNLNKNTINLKYHLTFLKNSLEFPMGFKSKTVWI